MTSPDKIKELREKWDKEWGNEMLGETLGHDKANQKFIPDWWLAELSSLLQARDREIIEKACEILKFYAIDRPIENCPIITQNHFKILLEHHITTLTEEDNE